MPSPSSSTRSRTKNPGSQSALRHLNQQRIIECLLNGPSTQAELARQTGLSTATVSNIVKIMQDSGLASTEPTTSSGRRALNVRLNSNGAVAVGIDFGRRHLRVVLASLSYHIIAEESVLLPLGHHAEQGIQAAVALLDKLLADSGVERSAVVGAGVGIPGPIDRRTSTVAQGAILPEWVGIHIQERLEEAFLFPIFIDNDSNLGALSEVTWGPHSGISNLLFMKIGSGIGAGLILNGNPYYGNVGITGEIGHATIHEHGLICRCGNRGCLETIASTTTMIELLGRGEERPLTPEEHRPESPGEGFRHPARGGRRRPCCGQGSRERGQPDQPRGDRGGRSPGRAGRHPAGPHPARTGAARRAGHRRNHHPDHVLAE
jgi:hypothetical protein